MVSWMMGAGILLALALGVTAPAPRDPLAAAQPPVFRALPCNLDALAATLEGEAGWRDIRPAAIRDHALAAELAEMMPSFDLAFVHPRSRGVLLVQGALLDGGEAPGDPAFWEEVVNETRRACADTGVACAVERLPDAPYGIAARTRLEEAGQPVRRITVAFVAPNACSYAIQFSGPERSFSEQDWQELTHRLASLRKIVVKARP